MPRAPGLRVFRAADFAARPSTPAVHPGSARESSARDLAAAAVLVCVLPLFAQSFHYLNELPPPYFLSKAWPILVLPLTVYGSVTLQLPAKSLFVALLAYLVGLTPIVSMVQLGNGLVDALTTTVKVWPFTYYFALAAALVWLRPEPGVLRRVLLGLGWFTFGLMVFLWITVPDAWYGNDAALGKLLLVEEERGYRIYMPMFFGMLLIFYLARRFYAHREWWTAVSVVVAFVLLFSIFKQRASIGGAIVVVLLASVSSLAPRLRGVLFAAGATVMAGALFLSLGWDQLDDAASASLGASLDVRQVSIANAVTYLGSDMAKWFVGVGATTRFGSVTLVDIFGNAMFYLADIGWLGVVFEYGIFGAALIALVYVAGYFIARPRRDEQGDLLRQAFADYVLFLMITSAVYSLVFTPGELATIMALSFYFRFAAGAPVQADPAGGVPASTILMRRPAVTHAATNPKTAR